MEGGATGTSRVAGWTGIRFAGAGTANATLPPVVDNGASSAGAMFNVGTTGAGERALARLASGTTIPRLGVMFTNTAGNAITQLALAGVMELWKSGSSNVGAEILPFEYSLDATSLTTGTWTAVTEMDLVE